MSWAGGGIDVTLASDKVGMVPAVGPMTSGTEERYDTVVGELLAALDGRLAGASDRVRRVLLAERDEVDAVG